jgi:hypothetical protein
MAGYRGSRFDDIRNWETDPSLCELCRAVRRAQARGLPLPGRPTRTVAIVPVGLPDQIRAFLRELSGSSRPGPPPFYQALNLFREAGVNRAFLAALLRYDAARAGNPSRQPVRWNDITIDELRESESTRRVRIVQEAADAAASGNGEAIIG